jgi:hypothetical protein
MATPAFIPLVDQYSNYSPQPTGDIVVPQSPSGSVTNESSTWEYNNSELAVQNYTAAMVSAAHQGIAFQFNTPVTPGVAPLGASVGLKEDVETTPGAPSGSYVQQGAVALTETHIAAAEATNYSMRFQVNLGN